MEGSQRLGSQSVGRGSLDAEESGLYALDDKMLLKSFQQKRINEYPPGIFHRLCEGGVGRKRLLL